MWKVLVAGAMVIGIAGSTMVYAQQQPINYSGAQRWRPSAEDASAFIDARIAALKAGLRLTAAQEQHWPAFEQAMREAAAMRQAYRAERRDQPDADRSDPIERLQRRADAMSKAGSVLKKLADTGGPLYQSLDEAQKRRFTILSRMSGPRDHGMGPGWRFRGGEGRDFRRDERL